jgi:hypothetical protein
MKKMSKMIYRHIKDGKFEVTMEDGEIKNLGPNASGMIRYTYFEDYTIPPEGWEVSREKLMQDYHAKVVKDMEAGNFEVSHVDEDGIKHYKHKDDRDEQV